MSITSMSNKFIVFDEYQDEYHFCDTRAEAIKEAGDCLSTMFSDGGGDSGCDMIIYKRIGSVSGKITVDTTEIWDEDDEDMVQTEPLTSADLD